MSERQSGRDPGADQSKRCTTTTPLQCEAELTPLMSQMTAGFVLIASVWFHLLKGAGSSPFRQGSSVALDGRGTHVHAEAHTSGVSAR